MARTLVSVASPWAYALVFAMAASESSLMVGLVVPGETVLLVGGYLAYRGGVNLVGIWGVAAAGAMVGDSVGFVLGRHFGRRLERSRLGRRIGAQRWNRARGYFDRRGGRAVFVARFITFARSLVPVLAGDAGMAYPTFLAWSAAGCILWSAVHVGLGYVAGPSYHTVERVAGTVGMVLLAALLVVGAGIAAVRRYKTSQ